MIRLFLAYTLFILILALPFLVVWGIAWAFAEGIAMLAAGRMVAGGLLVTASTAAALLLRHWAITPPRDPKRDTPHAVVHKTWQGMRARYLAMKWLADGTFQRLADEEKARKARESDDPKL